MGEKTDCELCAYPGGDLLWEDGLCRVVRVTDQAAEAFPGFCRVVWHRHVSELSDLAPQDAHHALNILLATERAVRSTVEPDKINLASLGNMVPHLHWHVIPRWKDDSHFPAPIWASAQRAGAAHPIPDSADLRRALNAELSSLIQTP